MKKRFIRLEATAATVASTVAKTQAATKAAGHAGPTSLVIFLNVPRRARR